MTSSPDFTTLPNRQLPTGDALLVVDTLGPFNLSRLSQPLIKVAFTPLEQSDAQLAARLSKQQRVVDLHVADLMTVGPGTLVQRQLLQRHPRGFLQTLNINLSMPACEVRTFHDLAHIFGPQGAYPLTSTWPMIHPLKCLCFTTKRGTVLIPCLDAWRFTLATSSSLLVLSTRPECADLLTTAREQSFLETQAGQRLALPLASPVFSTLTEHQEWQKTVKSSTLHLSVPPGFSERELPFLNWCMVDDLAFRAVTRFYTSLVSSRPQNRTTEAHLPLAYPEFRFPFTGAPQFRLQGTWLTAHETRYFLALHIDRCDADIVLPQQVIHTLPAVRTEAAEGVSETPGDEKEWRGRKPMIDMQEAEVDSLIPPAARLVTLHFGLRRQRFAHLQGIELTGDEREDDSRLPVALGEKKTPDQQVSLGDNELGGDGGRRVKLEERPPQHQPPEQRPVDHAVQFCDLLGVCQELKRRGIQFEFMPLGERVEGDPTTLIPATLGTAATWVGLGITARRALIARLSYRGKVAYALEWERMKPKEYGRLLLCTIDPAHDEQKVLLHLLEECAQQRGVWPETAGHRNTISLFRISHRVPHDALMSRAIYQTLIALQWPLPAMTDMA